MSDLTKLIILLLFCFYCPTVKAQEYAAQLDTLQSKINIADGKRNYPQYKKLITERYNLTLEHHDTAEVVRSCVRIVHYYTVYELNNDSADAYRQKGIIWAKLAKDVEHENDLRASKATQYTANGKFAEAYAIYQQFDSIFNNSNFGYGTVTSFNESYANLLRVLDKNEESKNRFLMNVKSYEKEEEWQRLAIVYINVAVVYYGLKKVDSTFAYLDKAQAINIAQKDTYAIAECYTRYGTLYKKLGRNKEALEYFKRAFECVPGNPSEFILTNYTTFLMSSGRFKEAEDILLNLRINCPNKETQLRAINGLVDLYKNQGKYKEALAYAQEYEEKREEYLNLEKLKQIDELQTQYDVATKENEIALLHERNAHQAKTLSKNRIILYVSIGLSLMMLLAVFLMFRNRAIRLKAEQISLEQQLLRLQMNPHFIFNSLSNIQSTILQKEHLKAAGYIATFSKLMRSILENSVHGKVTFSNELSALKDYLVLQKIRYNERFDYEIEVDEDVEEDIVSIPPMLFQPIVENAIEHGISGKTDGFIHIHFSQFDNHIHCTVTDNGIGYGNNVKSSETTKEKTSLSTQITKRRLEILSKKFSKQTLDYKVSVLKNENGAITGTRVEIDLPILS